VTQRTGRFLSIYMIEAFLCLMILAGCMIGNSDLSKLGTPSQTCFSGKGSVPGPVIFHPTPGQSGLYVAGGAGIYRFSTTGGHLTPIWLYRMHDCIALTPIPNSVGPRPTYAPPLIQDGLTVANNMVFFGAVEGRGSWVDLYALHAADGSLAWKQRITDVSAIGGLLVARDLIYIETGASTDSSDYIIRAINVRDGSLRWSYRYQTDFSDSSQGLNDVGNGGLYVTTSHILYALNATTGTKLWQVNIPSDQKFSGVLLFDRTVYATSSSGCFNCEVQPDSSAVFAFNASTGKQVWQSQRVAGFLTYPIEANDIVYAGSQDGHLYALRAANGTVLWRSYAGGELHVKPQINDGLVFVGTAPFLGKDDPNTTSTHLFASDAIHGNQRWSYTFSPNKYDGYMPIFVGNGLLYTISDDNNFDIHFIDILQATTGKLVQQQSITISGYFISLVFAP
jgi:outer membrane protein assembly factor BamB